MVTLLVKTIYKKKTERKICSESRDIDENKIVQWLGETFGIFRLAAEWRRIAFVYDVIGNMAIATSVDGSGFEPSQETGVKKMINGNVSSEFISLWFASVYGAASSIQNASRHWFYAYKKYKNGNSTRSTA